MNLFSRVDAIYCTSFEFAATASRYTFLFLSLQVGARRLAYSVAIRGPLPFLLVLCKLYYRRLRPVRKHVALGTFR